MGFSDFIDLCSDDEVGEADAKVVKQEVGLDQSNQREDHYKAERAQQQNFKTNSKRRDLKKNRTSNAFNTNQSSTCILDQGDSMGNGTTSASRLPAAPVCRQFWKAGNYDDTQASKSILKGGQNHLRVHPKFLHSNATSHKWAFGAIAELLDNAFDEIPNGATFVTVDKILNPRNGSPALLIQDNGGGMDPESMRRCMSFGFSDKKSKSCIGQYGNGFKTSTMRLGADAIVFSRHNNKRMFTQSVGLLSYTFMTQTGHDRIVVPMVDYELDISTRVLKNSHHYSKEHFRTNLSMLLEWSPYGNEAGLIKQFDDIGDHGTKVIIYNLWFSDDGDLELDFESDPKDILISGAPKSIIGPNHLKNIIEQHVANRFHFSLRVYSSILYLRVPEHFKIILRGHVVEHYNIAKDLQFPEFIMYKPKVGGFLQAEVLTTLGFLKDAPHVNISGFSVYHKNRLIMPFWRVVSHSNHKGRGVVGVLEANFIEPTHNKQEFEKTSLFQKLEARLKEMTLEYWQYHCGLIGYGQKKSATTEPAPPISEACSGLQPVTIDPNSPAIRSATVASVPPSQLLGRRPGESIDNYQTTSPPGIPKKRKEHGHTVESGLLKRRAGSGENVTNRRHNCEAQPINGTEKRLREKETADLMQDNKKLIAQCLESEKRQEELNLKIEQLRIELLESKHEYERLLRESQSLALSMSIKEETT